MKTAWANVTVALFLAVVGGVYIGQHGNPGIAIILLVDAALFAVLAVFEDRVPTCTPGAKG